MKCIGGKAINFIWPIAVLALLSANSKDILRPACVYADLARHYCLRVNNNDQTKCEMPLCKQ
jgi:hypothetical protein